MNDKNSEWLRISRSLNSPVALSSEWVRKYVLQIFTEDEIRKQNIQKLIEERKNKLNNLNNIKNN